MIYSIFAALLIAQTVYISVLFRSFRKKVYLDVLDFVIERQKKKDVEDVESEEVFHSTPARPHLRLVK